MVEEESIGVRIANRIAIGCNIDDTIWYDDTTTMADEIDIELEKAEIKGRKEGAITFGKKVLELAEKTIRSDHENCICENCCGYHQFKANLKKELKLLGGETK